MYLSIQKQQRCPQNIAALHIFSLLPYLIKPLQNLPHLRRDPFPAFLLQLLRHPVERFRHAARDTGQRITVPSQGHRCPDHVLEAFPFQECRDRFRHRLLTGLQDYLYKQGYVWSEPQKQFRPIGYDQ